MLLGTYEGRVDSQGRLVIPQRLRSAVETGMTVAIGLDGCLDVYPAEAWEKRVEQVRKLPDYDRDARTMKRAILGNAFPATLDRQGRIALPAPLRSYAAITDEVRMVAADTYFEIWSERKYEEQQGKAPDLADVAERLGRMNTNRD